MQLKIVKGDSLGEACQQRKLATCMCPQALGQRNHAGHDLEEGAGAADAWVWVGFRVGVVRIRRAREGRRLLLSDMPQPATLCNQEVSCVPFTI